MGPARVIALYAVTSLGAITSNDASLVHIPVVVSGPITATSPAFALLFGFLLQRTTEVISPGWWPGRWPSRPGGPS